MIDEGEGALHVSRGLVIPAAEIAIRTSTSGGPGGQHANRSQSRVVARFDVANSPSLGPRQRSRLLARLGPVVDAAAGDSRSQARNRALARTRLAAKLAAALRVDSTRRPTRPTKASVDRRLDAKRRRSTRKQDRRPRRPGDED